jgi:FimV-like protein
MSILFFLNAIWSNIKTHPVLFFEFAVGAISFFLVMLFLTKKPHAVFTSSTMTAVEPVKKSTIIITSHDIKAIAGDNILATQIDLARAYIEIGKAKLAKKILYHVIQYGNAGQQEAAQQLIEFIK